MTATAAPHIPVLMDEAIAALMIEPGERHVDGTYGAGGYARVMVAAGALVTAFDRDPDVATPKDGAITLIRDRFSRIADHVDSVDGVVLDIGVSSMQLDQRHRGFSFQSDGPLDMRMEQDGQTAADYLNTADEADIADVIYRYGDEPKSRRIARAIVAARPLETTAQLARVVRKAVGWRDGDKKDPATRSFQAIRIHINDELEELRLGLDAAERVLKPGGRLAVVTFHSLEDRVVKSFFRQRSGSEPAGSRHIPVAAFAAHAPSFEAVSKAVRPSNAEVARNPRARSATLRSARRTDAAAWASQKDKAL
jgi:16S rRNA (cytosine1402-N4)-methyltransferase